MKIIPMMMVVMICASGSWHHGPSLPWEASAFELRIPGLDDETTTEGIVRDFMQIELLCSRNIPFQIDKTSEAPAEGHTMEGQSKTLAEGESEEDGEKQTEAPAIDKSNEASLTTVADEKTTKKESKVTEKSSKSATTPEPSKTAASNPVAEEEKPTENVHNNSTEEPTKTTKAKETAGTKEGEKSTQNNDKEEGEATTVPANKSTQKTPVRENNQNEPTEAPKAKQTTVAKDGGKSSETELDKTTEKSSKSATTQEPLKIAASNLVAEDGKPTENAQNNSTEEPTTATTTKETAEAKDVEKSTQKSDKGDSEATQNKPTETPKGTQTTVAKDDGFSSPTELVKTTEKPKQQHSVSTPASNPKDEEEENSTRSQYDNDEEDDFDISDIWDDTEEPPEEFGREYDLDPSLLDSGNDLGDFQPKLELPPDMTKDMFFESPADAKSPGQDADDEGKGFFDRIKKFFSIDSIKEQLDTIPGKIQALMDQFRQKKSDGLKKLREQMDGSAEKVGQKIVEAFSKLNASQQTRQQCMEQVQESFKQYEAALQRGIKPCMDKALNEQGKQERALRNAQAKFTKMLTDVQGCVNKLDASSINSFVSSILHVGSCTKNNIQSKIEESLQPQMRRLSKMFQQHSSALHGNMNATGRCIERQLQLPRFQKMQQELVGNGKQCLESK